MKITQEAPYRCVDGEIILNVHHFSVRRDTLVTSNGDEFIRDVEIHRGSVAILALNEQNQIAFICQYRFPLRRWTIEIPTGGTEHNETALETATRELKEEAGLSANRIKLFFSFYNSPGHSDQLTRIYLAEKCQSGQTKPSGPDEQGSSVVFLTLKEALKAIDDGSIMDAKTIIALGQLERSKSFLEVNNE